MRDQLIALGAVAGITALLRVASPIANATTVALCLLLGVLFVALSLSRVGRFRPTISAGQRRRPAERAVAATLRSDTLAAPGRR